MIDALVIGRNGQVAMALAEQAQHHKHIRLTTIGRPEHDLEIPDTVVAGILAVRPDVVVNAAAYTAVDKAESEPMRAFAVNRDGAAAAARAAAQLGVPFIHLSTDYVYSGQKQTPYVETDVTEPLCVYGLSKLAGEQAVMAAHPSPIILRTSWVFSPFGNNFLKTMLKIGAQRDVVRVVDDQHGNPTNAQAIADAILHLVPRLSVSPRTGGVYHFCGTGSTSWFGFARSIFSESAALGGPSPRVEPITTAEYPTPAHRPANSRLETSAFAERFGFAPPAWTETLPNTIKRILTGSRAVD